MDSKIEARRHLEMMRRCFTETGSIVSAQCTVAMLLFLDAMLQELEGIKAAKPARRKHEPA